MNIISKTIQKARGFNQKVDEFNYFFRETTGQKEAQIKALGHKINEINRRVFPEKMNFMIKTKPGLDRSYFDKEGKMPRWIHEVKPGEYEFSKEWI